MKQFKQHYLFALLLALTVLSACRKDNNGTGEPEKPTAERKGIYVLSEGLMNANNTSLSYYNYDNQELIADQFTAVNGRGLGDTGNDIKIYGSKMYIVVNVSSTLEIVNPKTGVAIKKLDIKDNNVGRQPRYIVFNKNKAYLSSYDGTVAVIDTASLAIEKYIKVGRNPEKMAVANGKLYVANSGGLDYPNYDNTVSVIDLNTNTEIKKISVVINPRGVVADQYGDVYVLSTGNYGNIKSSMAIINSRTDLVTSQKDFSGGNMVINGDLAYITASGGKLKVYNVKTETVEKENFIADDTKITAMYGVAVDELTGEVFITDAKNYFTSGEVFCFGQNGMKKYSIAVGISPNNVVFINK
ncbi:YVTN family beta-propeller protein [Pedobacter sp. CAN_A7]|uniref:YncE family protein n=1 Tax=Pedobacter sp. CAN_A7 TaxID=2787722 RepID=UPI0018CA6D79